MKRIAANKSKDLNTHLVFAGAYYYVDEDRLGAIILKGMAKYNIKSVMVTTLFMEKHHLITKEVMMNYCKGREVERDSVMDDLESFIDYIRLGKKSYRREIWTYYLPRAGFRMVALKSASDVFQELMISASINLKTFLS